MLLLLLYVYFVSLGEMLWILFEERGLRLSSNLQIFHNWATTQHTRRAGGEGVTILRPKIFFQSLQNLKRRNALNFLWSLNRIFSVSILKQENCAIFISELGKFFRTLLSFTGVGANSFWIKLESYNFQPLIFYWQFAVK